MEFLSLIELQEKINQALTDVNRKGWPIRSTCDEKAQALKNRLFSDDTIRALSPSFGLTRKLTEEGIHEYTLSFDERLTEVQFVFTFNIPQGKLSVLCQAFRSNKELREQGELHD